MVPESPLESTEYGLAPTGKDANQAYAQFGPSARTRYRNGLLPG